MKKEEFNFTFQRRKTYMINYLKFKFDHILVQQVLWWFNFNFRMVYFVNWLFQISQL